MICILILKKKLKGNLIRITDATVSETIDLVLEVDEVKAKSFATNDIYVELDLSVAKAYTLQLPEIDSLGGFLSLNIYVSDISGKIDPEANLTILVGDESEDTIGGQSKVVIQSRFSGMYITPLSSKQWGTFYTTNVSAKSSLLKADDVVVAFEKKAG